MDFDSFVLAAATNDLTDEPAAREHADAVEFRLDLASDPLDQLADYDGDLPLIATNRASWDGGEAGEDRLDVLEEALDHSAVEAIDLELACFRTDGVTGEAERERARELRERAREQDVSVIVSVHDFETTPPEDDLLTLLASASAEGDVGKLAVTASDHDDTLALLSATHHATADGERVATMAMGEPGQHTRAVAPLYGSKIGYAPVDPANATAPGQYDLATLSELVTRLTTDESEP